MLKTKEQLLFTESVAEDLSLFLSNRNETGIFIITDDKVYEHCYHPVEAGLKKYEPKVYKIGQGEKNKTIETVQKVWDFLFASGADRKNSLVINIGGGLVCDLGAFAASAYKRGIPFVNIPTSLLAQADAAIGGKNGINYAGAKNQIGFFGVAETTIIYPAFTKTLSKREFTNGLAEMFKHALLHTKNHHDKLTAYSRQLADKENIIPAELLKESISVKLHYVEKDRKEQGIRAALNFGHTFGHAIESIYSQEKNPLKHGEAVAAGMIMELYISHKKYKFPLKEFLSITEQLSMIYPNIITLESKAEKIHHAMQFDKKNKGNTIATVLLSDYGQPVTDCLIDYEVIQDAISFYLQMAK